MATVLLDTGPLVAAFNKDDPDHHQAVEYFKAGGARYLTTSAVLTETCYMLDYDSGRPRAFLTWVARLIGAARLAVTDPAEAIDLEQIVAMMAKYADAQMDYADATLVWLATRSRQRRIFTFDGDFAVYRPWNNLRFQIDA